MGKVIRVKKGNEVLEIADSDLQDAVKDGYLPTERIIVANTKTKETYEIDPKDLPNAFKDGFTYAPPKKKVSSLSYEHTPLVSEAQLQSQNALSDIENIRKAKDLSQKQIANVTGGTGGAGVSFSPNMAAVGEANKIYEGLNQKGITKEDAEDIYTSFQDFPKKAQGVDYSQLLQERKENPLAFKRHVAAYKWQTPLFNKIRQEEGENAEMIINDFVQSAQGGTFESKRAATQKAIEYANKHFSGDEKKKVINAIKADRAFSYGDSDKTADAVRYDPRYLGGSGFNQYHIEALQYLADTDPETYKSFERLLEGNAGVGEDGRLGYERKSRELEQIGMKLELDNLRERLQNFNAKNEKEGGLSQQEFDEANRLQDKMALLQEDIKGQRERYPKIAAVDADRLAQEAIGQRSGAAKKFVLGVGENVDDAIDWVGDILQSPFRSDKQKSIDDLEELGDKYFNRNVTQYTTSENQLIQPEAKASFNPELQEKIKQQTGSFDERLNKVRNLILDDFDGVSTVKNPDAGKFNFTANAWANTVSDVGKELASQIAIAATTGGMGNISKSRQLLSLFGTTYATTYNDFYAEAMEKNIPNPTTYAIKHTAVEAASELLNNDLAVAKRMANPKSTLGQVLKNVTKQEWDNILREGTGKFSTLKKALIETGKAGGKTTAQETFEEVVGEGGHNLLEGENATDNMKSTIVNTTLGMLPLSFLGLPGQISKLNRTQKYALYEAVQNQEKYLFQLEQDVKDGVLSEAKANQIKAIIENSSKTLNELQEKNTLSDKTDNQKADLLANSMESGVDEAIEKGVPDPPIKGHMAFEEDFSPQETAAIDAIKERDFEGTGLKHYADVIKDENSTPKEIKDALKGISDQLTDSFSAETTDQQLQGAADAIYDLGYEKMPDTKLPTPEVAPTPISESNVEGVDENRIQPISKLKEELNKVKAPSKLIEAVPDDTELRESFLTDNKRILDSLMGLMGSYNTENNTIKLGKFYNTIFNERKITLIHEAVHAATMVTYQDILKNPDKYTKEQTLAVEELNDIALEYMMNTSTLAKYIPKLYGTTDQFEFIAEFVSNKEFRKWVSENNPTKKTNILNYIWDKILKVLGLKKAEINNELLEKIQKGIDSIYDGAISNKNNLEKIKPNETSPIQEGTESTQSVPSIQETTTTETVAEPPSPPTEGEAVAGEEESGLSGIKKALVSDEIIKGVDLERVSDKEMMALGRKILDTGEVNPEALVTKIITEGKGVLTPTEVVALITYKRDVDNKLQDTYKEINKRKEAGEDLGTLGVEAADLERQQHDFDVMAVITAQQQSMAFRLRQRMLDRDYNVVTQIEKYKKNNNGYIPEEVEAKFKELGKQLDEVKAKLAEAEKKASEKDGQEAVDNIKESVGREQLFTDEQIEQKVKEGVQKEIDAIYDKLPKEKRSLADKAIKALENVQKKLRGGTYSDASGIVAIIDAGITTIKNAIKAGVAIADAVDIGIKKIKELIVKKGIKDFNEDQFRKDAIEGFEAEGVSTKKVKDKPTINEDGTVSIPNQMIRDLVSKGVTDINDLADAVHKEVAKDLPDITKRQVRDYITDYGKTINPTADEIQQQVNTAKRVGRLLSELEDLQNKKAKTKKPESRNKITEKEREIKRKIRALEKDLGISNKRVLSEDEKLASAKQRVKDRIAELERKIKNKDFTKKKKLPEKKDDELVSLEAQKEKLQQEFDNEQYKVELKNRSWAKKLEDVALEVFSGVVRGLVASFDVSATFVQGMYRLFVDIGKSAIQLAQLKKPSPNRSFNAVGTMFRSLFSQKFADDYLNKVKSSEAYPLMQASKLAIDDKSGHVSAKEGLFISNWVNLIWDKVAAPALGIPISIATKGNVRKAYDIAKAINPYLASQRAFDGYVNAIRVNSFKDFAKYLEKGGHTFESDDKVFKKAADVVNTTTGRGSLGAADASSRWLNIFLFAPRKVISEVKLFTPYAFLYYAKLPKPVRTKALKDLATFLGAFTTANALLWAASKPDEDDEEEMKRWRDFWNLNSSNFLTHKIGNKRVSIGGGAKSMLTFQSRLLSGKFVDQYGNETELGDRFGKQINTRFDLITNFIAGKTSPVFNVAIKKAQERKNLEVDNADIIKDLTVPIWMQDLKDLYKDDPASVNTILTALTLFGANVRAVDDGNKRSSFTDEDRKDPTFKYFLDKGMNLPNVVPASIDVPDKETKEMKNLTDFPEEKIEQYRILHKENLKKELSEVIKRGYVFVDDYGGVSQDRQKDSEKTKLDDLTKEQLAKVLKSAQVAATNKTKNKLFPK